MARSVWTLPVLILCVGCTGSGSPLTQGPDRCGPLKGLREMLLSERNVGDYGMRVEGKRQGMPGECAGHGLLHPLRGGAPVAKQREARRRLVEGGTTGQVIVDASQGMHSATIFCIHGPEVVWPSSLFCVTCSSDRISSPAMRIKKSAWRLSFCERQMPVG